MKKNETGDRKLSPELKQDVRQVNFKCTDETKQKMLRLTALPYTQASGDLALLRPWAESEKPRHQIQLERKTPRGSRAGMWARGQRGTKVSEPQHLKTLHTGHWAVTLAEGTVDCPGVSSALKHLRGPCSLIYSTHTWGDQVLFQVLTAEQRTRPTRFLPPGAQILSSSRVKHQIPESSCFGYSLGSR